MPNNSTLVVVVEAGEVIAVLGKNKARVIVVNYDVEGSSEIDRSLINNDDGKQVEAIVTEQETDTYSTTVYSSAISIADLFKEL